MPEPIYSLYAPTPLQMTDTTQSKEIIQKYRRVFLNAIHYGMVNRDEIKFLYNQYDEIEDEIKLALKIVERYNFGGFEETIKTYAVAVLPFMVFDGKLIDPKTETKEAYEQILTWLNWIWNNKGMANHLIYQTTSDNWKEGIPIAFDDITGFDKDKVGNQIDIYEQLNKMDVGREKRNWWGSSGALLHCMCFAYSVYLCWSRDKHEDGKIRRIAQQDRIIDFLYQFFQEMGYPIDDESIRTNILNKAKKEPFINCNPYFLRDHIL